MFDWRKNKRWIIGYFIASIAIVGIIIWFLSLPDLNFIFSSKLSIVASELLSVFVGAIIGGGMIKYYFENLRFSRDKELQEREWARTDLKEMVKDVYGPLYDQIEKGIIKKLEKTPFSHIHFETWSNLPKHICIQVPEKLEEQLDEFLIKIKTHYSKVYDFKTKTLPDIFNEEANRIYQPPDKTKFKLEYSYKENKRPANTDLYNPYNTEGEPYFPERTETIIECLRTNTNPKDYITKPGRTITGFWIKDINSDWNNANDTDFNNFWEYFKNRIYQNKEFTNIPKEANDILKEADKIMKQLRNRIKKS